MRHSEKQPKKKTSKSTSIPISKHEITNELASVPQLMKSTKAHDQFFEVGGVYQASPLPLL
jgi:hypothetical protein